MHPIAGQDLGNVKHPSILRTHPQPKIVIFPAMLDWTISARIQEVVAADHRRLENSWEHIRSQVEFFLNARNDSFRDFLQVGYAEHAELRDVLAKRDPELAAKAIQSHLEGAYHRLLTTHPQE